MTLATRALFAVAVASWLCACSFVHGGHQRVTISTNVPAKIYAGNRLVGETNGGPATAKLRRGKGHVITARAKGYDEVSTRLERQITLLGALDLAGAILLVVPVITFATGHAYALTPGEIHLDLEERGR